MSQVGTIISVAPSSGGPGASFSWNVQFTYQLDAGGVGQSNVLVGPGSAAQVAMWTSPNSQISVTAPGAAQPILLNCPPLIQYAAFGIKSPGIPYAGA